MMKTPASLPLNDTGHQIVFYCKWTPCSCTVFSYCCHVHLWSVSSGDQLQLFGGKGGRGGPAACFLHLFQMDMSKRSALYSLGGHGGSYSQLEEQQQQHLGTHPPVRTFKSLCHWVFAAALHRIKPKLLNSLP